MWGEVPDLLSTTHRVIAYDRRGFTRSTHEPVRNASRHTEDAAALLRAIDAAPATVVGWSSGGLIAMDLAIRSPELVGALALEEPPLYLIRRPGLRQLRGVLTAKALSWAGRERAASEGFFRWAFRWRAGDGGYDHLPSAIREPLLANHPANMGDIGAGTGEHMSKDEIAGIHCPVLCITGELSDAALTRATGYVLNMVPQARIRRIDGAGHAMHLERPAEFADAVREAAAAV